VDEGRRFKVQVGDFRCIGEGGDGGEEGEGGVAGEGGEEGKGKRGRC
jgi:hypothetical protein